MECFNCGLKLEHGDICAQCLSWKVSIEVDTEERMSAELDEVQAKAKAYYAEVEALSARLSAIADILFPGQVVSEEQIMQELVRLKERA